MSGILGNSKYIIGDKPYPEDCTLFSVLDVYLNSKMIENDLLHSLIVKYDNLVSNVNNMQKELYPENKPSKFKEHQY